jgi:hypothetical protein
MAFPPHSPNQKPEETPKNAEKEIKRPEFIIIDDTTEYLHGPRFKSKEKQGVQAYQAFLEGKSWTFFLFLRIFSLFAALLCFMWMAGSFGLLVFFMALHTLLLFQSQTLNSLCIRFWEVLKLTTISMGGLVLSIFSPSLGFGLLILYFSMRNSEIGNELLKKMTKDIFNKF